MISGRGRSSAPAIFIADGATDYDVSCGYALSGDQENKLRSLCKGTHLKFDELYVTALIKEKINLKKPKENLPLLTEEYKGILLQEIRTIQPNVLVPLSELAFNFLTDLHDIRKFRGSILPANKNVQGDFLHTLRVIPALGPNPYLYEDPKMEFITLNDFSKIASNLDRSDPIPEIGKCWVAKTASEFRLFVERSYPNANFVVFDIETYANIPTCISFCFDGYESCCVPILDYKIPEDDRVLMLYQVAKLLSSSLPKVNQNVKFDWRKLRRFGFEVNNVSGDTLLGASCLYAEFPKNLGFLTSIYTDMPYFKDEGKEFDPRSYSRERLYLYNAKDSLATHQVYSKQLEEHREQGTEYVYNNLISILPIYAAMEDNGILVDDTRRKDLLAKYESLYETYVYKLRQLVGEEISPLSSQRVGKLVYDELKFDVIKGIKKNVSGTYKADEESLELLMWMSRCQSPREGKEILRTIIDCRKLHKVIEYLRLPLYPDKRHRCEFNLAGAETGRTTAGETTDYYLSFEKGKVKLKNMGHSFQTIGKHGFTVDMETYGKDIRSIFVPTPGYTFVEMDLSQAEARVDAVLARDYDILQVFDSPIGIHRLTGSWVYSCKPEEIEKNKLVLNEQGVGEERYLIAKTARHAFERNIQALKLMLMIHKPLKECERILKVCHGRQPNIRAEFHRDVVKEIDTKRLLVAPNGRRRDFFGRLNEGTYNEGISFLPQAVVTDIIKEALPAIYSATSGYTRFLSESHDSLFTEVREGREMEYVQISKRLLEHPVDFRKCSLSRDFELTIPCEASWSKTNWMEIEDLKI